MNEELQHKLEGIVDIQNRIVMLLTEKQEDKTKSGSYQYEKPIIVGLEVQRLLEVLKNQVERIKLCLTIPMKT